MFCIFIRFFGTSCICRYNDFVVNVGTGSIVLKGVTAGQSVTITDGSNPEAEPKTIVVPTIVNVTAGTAATNSSNNAIINGTTVAGGDTITNSGDNVLIYGFGGNDKINLGDNQGVTVIAGANNDTITATANHGNGVVYRFATGDGVNYIENFSAADTIQITNGAFTSVVAKGSTDDAPNDLILAIGVGTSINIKGYGVGDNEFVVMDSENKIHEITVPRLVLGDNNANELDVIEDDYEIRGYGGNDTITNEGATGITMDGGDGNDIITNNGFAGVIRGGMGNDTITNAGASSEINGDGGQDVIINTAENVKINDGADADRIYLEEGSKNAVVIFGEGNDTVFNNDSSNVHTYKLNVNSGSNTIVDFNNEKEVIQITDMSIYKYDDDGNIVTQTVTKKDETGAIVYKKNANGDYLDEDGNVTTDQTKYVAETEEVPVTVSVLDSITERNFVNNIFTVAFGTTTKSLQKHQTPITHTYISPIQCLQQAIQCLKQ